MQKECIVCRKQIIKISKISRRQWKNKKYCSWECRAIGVGLSQKGKNNPRYGKQYPVWNKGISWSDNAKKKMSASHMGKSYLKGTKRKDPAWNKGKYELKKCKGCDKMIRNINEYCSHECRKENRQKAILLLKKCIECSKDFEVGLSRKDQICCSDKCGRILQNKTRKEKWDNKEWREKQLSVMLNGMFKRPTRLEKDMISLIKNNNLPYKYTGDGSFWIGNPPKNPDFVNINGEKKLIEVGNIFHHKNYIEKRKEHFSQYGWESYIFIGDKLNKEEIINLLKGGY